MFAKMFLRVLTESTVSFLRSFRRLPLFSVIFNKILRALYNWGFTLSAIFMCCPIGCYHSPQYNGLNSDMETKCTRQFRNCVYIIKVQRTLIFFVYYIMLLAYDNAIIFSKFWEIITYVSLLGLCEFICSNHNKQNVRIPESCETMFWSSNTHLNSALKVLLFPKWY